MGMGMATMSKESGWAIINKCLRCGSNLLENAKSGMTFWSTWSEESDRCEHTPSDLDDLAQILPSEQSSEEKRS
jgi:hypothetical protein